MDETNLAPPPRWANDFIEDWEHGAAVIGWWRTLGDDERAALSIEDLSLLCIYLSRTMPFAETWVAGGSSVDAEVHWYITAEQLPQAARLMAWLGLDHDAPVPHDATTSVNGVPY